MKCIVLLVFHVFSLCFTVFSQQKHVLLVHFKWNQNTLVPYDLHEMLSVSIVFMCFHCRNMYFWYISHFYQNTHVPYILRQMHSFASVFRCFHCVFTVFSLQKHVLLVHFTCIQKIHMYNIFYTKFTVLLVFSLCFHSRNMYFWYISHVYQNI
jgi:hypothetical protein